MFSRRKLPVARTEGLLVEDVGDETVVYDAKTKAAHCLSPLAAAIFSNCDGRTTVEQLSALAAERLGEPVDSGRVIDALAQLEERELLAVSPSLAVPADDGEGLSRRQMIGKSAAAAGGAFVGASLITSITAPSAIAAASATCANILCCPCCTATDLNIVECCTTPLTRNCQCVQASQGERLGPDGVTIIEGGKFCKTAGQSAPTDAECINTIAPPLQWSTLCTPFVTGGADCGWCGQQPS